METGFVIHRHHGLGSRVGMRIALSKAVETGVGHLGQFLCAIHGHDLLMHFEPRRLSLRCESCGYETPGWEIGRKPRAAPRALRATDRFTRKPVVRRSAPRSPARRTDRLRHVRQGHRRVRVHARLRGRAARSPAILRIATSSVRPRSGISPSRPASFTTAPSFVWKTPSVFI